MFAVIVSKWASVKNNVKRPYRSVFACGGSWTIGGRWIWRCGNSTYSGGGGIASISSAGVRFSNEGLEFNLFSYLLG